MRRGSRKFVSLLVSLMVILNLGSQAFDVTALAHGLDHDRQAISAQNGQIHFHEFDTGSTTAPEPLSDVEHKFLHAVGSLQPPLISSFANGFGLPTTDVTPQLSRSFSLRILDQDPPFRPPQSS